MAANQYRCPVSEIISQEANVTIPVNIPGNSYKIVIGPGLVEHLGSLMMSDFVESNFKQLTKVLLVSNHCVFELCGRRVVDSLKKSGFDVAHCIVRDGEQYKNLETVATIYDAAVEHRLDRTSVIVALGGGVVGDMAGYAAATWLRGVALIQVPTTLLAMVDSSIGGKTGVNHPKGKNLIGAFYQPRLVLIDPELLTTLPVREFSAAMGEVIKYGVILDRELFHFLERQSHLDHKWSDWNTLKTVLYRSCKAKADVVSLDEKESGLRALLNYGHTVGHAIESLLHYQGVIHGEAVAIGMVAAGQLAVALGMWDAESLARQNALIEKAGLPTRIPAGLQTRDILEALKLDKKVKAGKVHFVLPTEIGRGRVTDAPSIELLETVLNSLKTV